MPAGLSRTALILLPWEGVPFSVQPQDKKPTSPLDTQHACLRQDWARLRNPLRRQHAAALLSCAARGTQLRSYRNYAIICYLPHTLPRTGTGFTTHGLSAASSKRMADNNSFYLVVYIGVILRLKASLHSLLHVTSLPSLTLQDPLMGGHSHRRALAACLCASF